jgi:hypothetical protein
MKRKTEREINVQNFKKVLILIAIIFVLLPLGTVSADTGPKPTMVFTFKQQASGAALTIVSGTLFECNRPDCQDAAPLKALGPQRLTCDATSCQALAYGFSPYHRLEVVFSDGKTRQSNVFQTDQFDSMYKVTIRPDDLLVEAQFSLDLFSPRTYLIICGCLAGILVVIILLVIFLVRRSRKKKAVPGGATESAATSHDTAPDL